MSSIKRISIIVTVLVVFSFSPELGAQPSGTAGLVFDYKDYIDYEFENENAELRFQIKWALINKRSDEEILPYINRMRSLGYKFDQDTDDGLWFDEAIREQIPNDLKISYGVYYRYNFLYTAYYNNNEELVKFLIECGFDPGYDDGIMFIHWVYYIEEYYRKKNWDMVRFFLQADFPDRFDGPAVCINHAIWSQDSDEIIFFLNEGFPVNYQYKKYETVNPDWNKMFSDPENYYIIENETPLYRAVSTGKLKAARLLVDYGADIKMKISSTLMEYLYDDEYSGDYTEIKHDPEIKSILKLTRESGYEDFADEIEEYLDGRKLSDLQILDFRTALEAGDYDSIFSQALDLDCGRYCERDREILRRVMFGCANAAFFKKDYKTAAELYAKGIVHAVSNTKGFYEPFQLKNVLLSEWIDEGKNNSPSYYLAYNAACAYSYLNEYEKAAEWLEIAIIIDRSMLATADKDSDLAGLRSQKDLYKKTTAAYR